MTKEELVSVITEIERQQFTLKSQLVRIKKQYINEHKQIKTELPVKVHFKTDTIDRDVYITRYDLMYLDDANIFVYPVIYMVKSDGYVSRKEVHYPKRGKVKFWEIGNEEQVHEIDFGE